MKYIILWLIMVLPLFPLRVKSQNIDLPSENFNKDIYAQNEVLTDSLLKNKAVRDSIFNVYFAVEGRSVTHIVGKGETWESISRDYLIAEDDLRRANPFESVCYIGLELNIPTLSNDEEIAVWNYQKKNALGFKAEEYGKKGDYKKAVNIYSDIINSSNVPLYVYMLRGEALMKRGKYDEAYRDFNYVKKNDKNGNYPQAAKNLSRIRRLKAEREAEKAEMWGNLFNFASAATNSYFQAKQYSRMASGAGNYMITPSVNTSGSVLNTLSTPGYVNQELTNMMYATFNQVNQQEQAEYQTFCMYNKKSDGSNYTYEEWSAMKGAAWKDANNQSGNNFADPVVEPRSSHECSVCHGSGRIAKELFPAQYGYTDVSKEKCDECGKYFPKSWGHTHLDCPNCHGKGYL